MGEAIRHIWSLYENQQAARDGLLSALAIAEYFEPETISEEVGEALCSDIFIFLAEVYEQCPRALDHAITGLLKTARRVEIAQQYKITETPPPEDEIDFLAKFETGWENLEAKADGSIEPHELETKTEENTTGQSKFLDDLDISEIQDDSAKSMYNLPWEELERVAAAEECKQGSKPKESETD